MTTIVLAWAASIALALNYLTQIALMVRHLEETDPETFAALGSPSLRGMSGATAGRVLRFVLRREYEVGHDDRLAQLGDRARLGFFLATVGLGVWAIAFGGFLS